MTSIIVDKFELKRLETNHMWIVYYNHIRLGKVAMTEGKSQTSTSKAIESLKVILEVQLSRDVAYEEAQEVGESLIDFYELLALEDRCDE